MNNCFEVIKTAIPFLYKKQIRNQLLYIKAPALLAAVKKDVIENKIGA